MKRRESRTLWMIGTVIGLSVLVLLGGLYCLHMQGKQASSEKEGDHEKIQTEVEEKEQSEPSEGETEEVASPEIIATGTDLTEPALQTDPEWEAVEKEEEVQSEQAYEESVDLSGLETAIRTEIETRAARWSVVVVNLSNQQTLVCDNAGTSSTKTTAASLIKLYIMAAAYDRINAGLLTDTDALEQSIYNMITVSSNEATNAVLRAIGDGDSTLGMQRVNAYCQAQGYTATQVNRLLGISNYSIENFTSAVDCSRILTAIYSGSCVSSQWSKKMLSLLRQQTVTYKIPAGISNQPVVTIGNKTGELPGLAEHDVAIITGEGFQYVLCVLCENSGQDDGAIGEISHISAMVYEAFS